MIYNLFENGLALGSRSVIHDYGFDRNIYASTTLENKNKPPSPRFETIAQTLSPYRPTHLISQYKDR